MENKKPSALFSLTGVMLVWLYVLIQTADGASLAAGLGEERHHVAKRSIEQCGSAFDRFCLNEGKCMLLVDVKEHVCKCERGFYGPRCAMPELVVSPMSEEQVILVLFTVGLLILGLIGALYFFCKWYKKNKYPHQQKEQGCKGVQKI